MAAFISFLLVVALGLVGYWGSSPGFGLRYLFGIYIPYAAFLFFLAVFIYRIVDWARSAVPFRIPTTAGQQKSHPWIKWSPLDTPRTNAGTVGRMILEVFAFRPLFRTVSSRVVHTPEGPKVVHNSEKWLWLFALLFHYTFLVIFIRHFRFFLDPVPMIPFRPLEFLDAIFQVGSPLLYQSDLLILVALSFLLLRRFFDSKVRYISNMADYFPLFLILGIVGTGITMRYFLKTDLPNIKVLTMGLVTLNPTVPAEIGGVFFIHLFLVSVLMVYFPLSKLMHAGGVFMSPTRNMPNDSRIRHHENPWNPPKSFHTYQEYENEFREPMFEAGIPVEKEPDEETQAE